jgi:Protein of unknown function (DUF2946)
LSRFYQKIGSWLGLLAILMATLAPTISHSLALHGSGGTAMEGEHCAMPEMASMPSMDSMPAMAPAPDHASGQTAGKSTQHSSMSGDDVCGYCSLLAHMPVVPSIEALFSVAVRALQHTVATRFERVRRVEPLTFAQPRAPPSLS